MRIRNPASVDATESNSVADPDFYTGSRIPDLESRIPDTKQQLKKDVKKIKSQSLLSKHKILKH